MWRQLETNLTSPLKISDTARDKKKEMEFGSVQTFTRFFLPSPFCFAPARAVGLELLPAAWLAGSSRVVPFLGKAPGKWNYQKVTCFPGYRQGNVSSEVWKGKYSKNTFSPESLLDARLTSQELFFEVGCLILLWIWLSRYSFEQAAETFKRPKPLPFLSAFLRMYDYRVHTRSCTHALCGPSWISVWDIELVLSKMQHWGLFAPTDVPRASGQLVRTLCSSHPPSLLGDSGRAEGSGVVLLEVLWSRPGSCCDGEDLIRESSHSFALSHCSEWANTAVLIWLLPLRSPAAASLTINGLLINAVKG